MTSKKPTKPTTRKKTVRRASTRGKRSSVRKRVHELTLRAIRDHDLSLRDIPALGRDVVHAAAEGLDHALPSSRRSTLRQVVDGLTDAASAAAGAAKATARSTAEHSSKFVRRDVKRTAKEVSDFEDRFLQALHRASRSLKGAAGDEIKTIVTESRRAGTKIRKSVSGAAKAADGHLVDLGRETAGSGVRAVRAALGTVLHGAGGLLEGLGEVATGSRTSRKKSKTKAKSRSTSKFRARKSPAKRTTARASTAKRKKSAKKATSRSQRTKKP